MNETVQTILALLLVGGCIGYVGLSAWRALRSRDGCGGRCGCGGSTPKQDAGQASPNHRPQFISRESLVRTTRRGTR